MASNVEDAIMLFGDSITQGAWQPDGLAQRLAYVYARKLDVINRGLSGYNTDWGIPVFEQVFATQHEQQHVPTVRLLTIWFGANDACLVPSPQHVPLSKFTSNIAQLVHTVTSPTSARYSPKTRIILITPPPVNTFQRGADLASREPPLKLDRDFDVTRQYAEAVKEVATREGVAVVDCWTLLWEAAGKDERALSAYLYDGLHLNGAGYGIVYDALIDTIAKTYPELHYDNLKLTFPAWGSIDRENPGPSLKKRNLFPDDK